MPKGRRPESRSHPSEYWENTVQCRHDLLAWRERCGASAAHDRLVVASSMATIAASRTAMLEADTLLGYGRGECPENIAEVDVLKLPFPEPFLTSSDRLQTNPFLGGVGTSAIDR